MYIYIYNIYIYICDIHDNLINSRRVFHTWWYGLGWWMFKDCVSWTLVCENRFRIFITGFVVGLPPHVLDPHYALSDKRPAPPCRRQGLDPNNLSPKTLWYYDCTVTIWLYIIVYYHYYHHYYKYYYHYYHLLSLLSWLSGFGPRRSRHSSICVSLSLSLYIYIYIYTSCRDRGRGTVPATAEPRKHTGGYRDHRRL